MRAVMRPSLLSVVVVLGMALATALAGLAHRAPTLSEGRLAALTLAGIGVEDLCGQMPEAMAGGCAFCTLAAPPDLPQGAEAETSARLIMLVSVAAPRESRTVRPVRDPGRGMRAPPVG